MRRVNIRCGRLRWGKGGLVFSGVAGLVNAQYLSYRGHDLAARQWENTRLWDMFSSTRHVRMLAG